MTITRLSSKQTVVVASLVAFLLSWSVLSAQEQKSQSSDMVYELGDGVTAPKGIYMPNPEYSEKGRRKKINGTVELAMVVTPEGKVRDVKVIKSLEESLDKQAIATVSTWRFEPATKDEMRVAVHLKTAVTFKLY